MRNKITRPSVGLNNPISPKMYETIDNSSI